MQSQHRRKIRRTKFDLLLYGHGISTAFIADRLGLNKSYVSAIAGGKIIPSDKMLKRLADYLGVQNPDSLLDKIECSSLLDAITALYGD